MTAMDTDKIKVFGARVKVDSTGKLAELERAERVWTSLLCCDDDPDSIMPEGKNESQG